MCKQFFLEKNVFSNLIDFKKNWYLFYLIKGLAGQRLFEVLAIHR